MTTIEFERKDLRPFERLAGRVTWQLGHRPRSLELRLFWYTRGRGMTDTGEVAKLALDPAVAGSREFSFELPEGPYSVNGALVAVVWGVELVDPEMGGMGWEAFTVSPVRKELVLERVESPRSEVQRKLSFGGKPTAKPS